MPVPDNLMFQLHQIRMRAVLEDTGQPDHVRRETRFLLEGAERKLKEAKALYARADRIHQEAARGSLTRKDGTS